MFNRTLFGIASWQWLRIGIWEWLGVGSWELGIGVKIPIEDSIDLHTFAPRDVASVVEEYVSTAHEAGLREVRLIHGRGKGVQRGIVQNTLEKHPLVVEFWDAPETHLGATVARLIN
jgi:DNA-nicking Smr family endonuclease